MGILRQHCIARTQPGSRIRNTDPITVGGATVFVLDISQMEKF